MLLPALFHWSPRDRRARIVHDGLVPGRRATVSSGEMPYVCLSPTPSSAWGLSGMGFAEPGSVWDLWQVRLDDDDQVTVPPHWGRWIREVRVHNRIHKRRVWWVGERTA
jgi:hypothetical protein